MLSIPRSTSSSTRTTRVIEELQENLENIQKELETTKTQLQIVKENKETNENENEKFIESNKQLRANIQEIMQILESKQKLLDSQKKISETTETKVKQLKDEALKARKELDGLKRRETSIKKERHQIQLNRQKQLDDQKTIEKSIDQSKIEFSKELEELQTQLETIQKTTQKVKQKDFENEAKAVFEKYVKERKTIIKNFENIQKEIELNNQNFIIQVKQELVQLLNHFSDNNNDQDLTAEIENCKNEFNTLISRIKSNASISII